MARRIDINRIIQSQFMRDLPAIMLGCAIAAFATDVFMIPNGLAAGGAHRSCDHHRRARPSVPASACPSVYRPSS
ncbi:MAG: hypothetical protein ACLTSX_02915 [Collinsella sp.]